MRWLSTRIGLPSSALWLLGGTFITTIGNGMQGFTIALLLYEHTGSAAAFGGVIIFEQVLTFVMQVLAGPWVDRGDPRRTCVQVDLLRGVVVCCASALFGTGHLVLWVMLVSLVIRVAHPFYRAATFALAPAVVSREALGRYNGFTNISLQAGQLTGIVLAGPVFYYLGGATAFFINGLTFLFSALAISRIRLPAAEPANQPAVGNAWNLVLTGWSEIAALLWRQAGFAWHLLLNTADAVAVHLFNLISVPLIAERYAGSAYWLSTIGVVYALGAMVAGALIAPLTNRWGARTAVAIGLGGQSLAFIGLGGLDNRVITLGFCFGLGLFNTISWTVLMTTLQLRLYGPVKGRVGTARSLLTSIITAISVQLVAEITTISLFWALIACGGLCLGFTLLTLTLGHTRLLGQRLLGETRQSAQDGPPAPVSGLAVESEGGL